MLHSEPHLGSFFASSHRRDWDILTFGDHVLVPSRGSGGGRDSNMMILPIFRIIRTQCWRSREARPWTEQRSASRESFGDTNTGACPHKPSSSLDWPEAKWPHSYLETQGSLNSLCAPHTLNLEYRQVPRCCQSALGEPEAGLGEKLRDKMSSVGTFSLC